MNFRALFHLLSEAPIGDFYFDKDSRTTESPHRKFSKHDKKYLENPEATKSFVQTFKNYKFNMYFAEDNPILKKYGAFVLDHKNVKDLKFQHIDLQNRIIQNASNEVISCLFVGNEADEPMPITPWQQAHRIGHAIVSERGGDYARHEFFIAFQEYLQPLLNKLICAKYHEFTQMGFEGMPLNQFVMYLDDYAKTCYPIMWALGTFKSARQKNTRNFYEFSFECIAQFLVTGSVKLNDAAFPEFSSEILECARNMNEHLKVLFDSLKGKFIQIAF